MGEFNAQKIVIESQNEQIEYMKEYSEKLESENRALNRALDKACDILEEGYGEEYASYIYMKNLDEGIEIPSNMNIGEWKEWLMKE